ncbi:hypothetical protein D3C83_54910 [compost metagenome]
MPCKSPTTFNIPVSIRCSCFSRFAQILIIAAFSASRSRFIASKPSTIERTRWANCGLQM